MAKLFLSFLGTNDYLACNYILDETRKVENVCYIQEALIRLETWQAGDRIRIFVSPEAEKINWDDRTQELIDQKIYKNPTLGKNDGLEKRLKELKLACDWKKVSVPNGETVQQMWEIFELVLNEIKSGDEIIFDITHGFRSMPMMAIIILSYAKALKENIIIRGIYYGAFEALGTAFEVKKMAIEQRNAPIFDLTAFAVLLDWAQAVNVFLKYGRAEELTKLADEEIRPLVIEKKGKDQGLNNINSAIKQMKVLSEAINTNRLKEIMQLVKLIKYEPFEKIGSIDSPVVPVINTLIDKLKTKSSIFSDKNSAIQNGMAAVVWCIEHKMIQQGYTILQETVITGILDVLSDKKEELILIEKREEIGYYLQGFMKKIEDMQKFVKKVIDIYNNIDKEILIDKLIESLEVQNEVEKLLINLHKNNIIDIKTFVKRYDALTQFRNDMNHAGLRPTSSNWEKISSELKPLYEYFTQFITDLYAYFTDTNVGDA
jgi:CRISPR-associated Csx2 family protein